jgi:hypothetical protein
MAGLAAAAFLAVPLVNASVGRASSVDVPTAEVVLAQPQAELGAPSAPAVQPEASDAVAEAAPEAAELPQAKVRTAGLTRPNDVDASSTFVALPRTFEAGDVTGLNAADAAPAGRRAGEAVAPAGTAQGNQGFWTPWTIGLVSGGAGFLGATIIWHDDLVDADDDDDDDDDDCDEVSVIYVDECY